MKNYGLPDMEKFRQKRQLVLSIESASAGEGR